MSFERRQENRVFIYGKMEPDFASTKLLEAIHKLSPEREAQARAAHEIFWLLRESREPGMLTVQRAEFDSRRHAWVSKNSMRLALTSRGWITPVTQEEIDQCKSEMTQVNREIAERYISQLETYIKDRLHLKIENRVNPAQSEQTSAAMYSSYLPPMDSKLTVLLPVDIWEALTCPFSEKTFKNPVVATHDIVFPNINKKVKKGVSYEQEELEKLGLQPLEDFYENTQLKTIISYIGSPVEPLVKLQKIEEFEIIDVVLGMPIKNAFITPAGLTYSYESLQAWIEQRGVDATDPKVPNVSISLFNIIPNRNLDLFISGWPTFYKDRRAELLWFANDRDMENKPSP